ncbi:ABC-2 type transport system permease protein [Rhodovulum imhoffii]|uniref:ABC-2 type transport system permease protein n=1 Tax=Rhodovulum imhoffii TaxID=365340 RepID=A0A2T5BUJ8_9RHOB|nr:ABC transporter permease [Rhodovulum imhoffii]MBK5934793.1 ABC transporter permease [Rhodovulum imhoffii]PTN03195.1 ABC-2 type transport system permease protein [Rhodovulum imhoffii]
MRALGNIFRLGVKELYSLARDPVLMGLILYTFTFAVFTVANGVRTEVRNAAVAIVDEDRSGISSRIIGALLPPYFKPPRVISSQEMNPAMDRGDYSFVLTIPSGFQRDLLAGKQPEIQLNVDATAMTLAGNGTRYIQRIVQTELERFVAEDGRQSVLPAEIVSRARFNPNLESKWFLAVMQVTGNITILSVILSGAAVIREREHGTIEHLLVMPLRPIEIMLAKIWANGLVIVSAAVLSLVLVVRGVLGIPVPGSVAVFAMGAGVYLFAVTSLGIMLATFARTMPQFGLLAIPVFVVLYMLSGGMTPLEAMPEPLHTGMQFSPATHFTSFAQAVLYRGAGLDLVWRDLLAVAAIGAVFCALALYRFRRTMSVG